MAEEARTEVGRLVHFKNGYVHVNYPKNLWSRGEAWLHLTQNTPSEVDEIPPRIPDRPETTNPWSRAHTASTWGWQAKQRNVRQAQGILDSEALKLWELAQVLEREQDAAVGDGEGYTPAATAIVNFIRAYKLEAFRDRPRVITIDRSIGLDEDDE